MFKITVVNLGPDMVSKDVIAHVDSQLEAEAFADKLIDEIMGWPENNLLYRSAATYDITVCGIPSGAVTITRMR